MSQADLAIVGLGVMGASLARNFHSRGLTVAVHNRSRDTTDAFLAEHGDARFVGAHDYAALAAATARPRKIVLMVTAGPVVDRVLDAVEPHLDPGDIVVDAGNSHFADTDRRIERARSAPWRFLGMGVSGGERGALEGPSMMPGGDQEAWDALRPQLEAAAAVSDTGPCVAWCGRGSAGHFVKMVHNGIEYGDMQLIAEAHDLLRTGLGLAPAQIADTFGAWNAGELQSYLIEITAGIVDYPDPHGDGVLLDAILDVAGQKGTGRWTSIAATELGVPIPTVTAAVDARAQSAMKAVRQRAATAFGVERGRIAGVSVTDLEHALYVAKVMSYTQGFDLLARASAERDYGTDLATMGRIWKAGCIIRAAFLDDVYEAFRADPTLPLLFLAEPFLGRLRERVPALRRVVAAAASAGLAVPALSASLAAFDTLTRGYGTANLIQAQRDWFGAHTYRRVDAPDTAVHTDWEGER